MKIRESSDFRYWKVTLDYHGFELYLVIQATEENLLDYLKSEVGRYKCYSGITKSELNAWKQAHCKVYIYK